MSNDSEANKNNEISTNSDSDSLACCQDTGSSSCAKVKAVTETMCDQVPVRPHVIRKGKVFVKIPVVIAETNITIPVEAVIKLDRKAIEIKRIRKNVYLTQCRLIPFSKDKKPGTGILYIAGFIRKNIEYATESCISSDHKNICGDIRHCTVEVPFNCTTRVKFLRPPVFVENDTPSELEFFTDQLRSCDVCADPVIGREPCDQNFTTTEIFNEKPFCELVKAKITEIDIHKNPEPIRRSFCENPTEQEFSKFTEKIVVDLTLKVLQKQQILLEAKDFNKHCDDDAYYFENDESNKDYEDDL